MRRTGQEISLAVNADRDQVPERRRFERYQVEVPTMVELIAPYESQPHFLKTLNISAQGAYLSTPKPFLENSRIRLSFILEFSESDASVNAGRTILIAVTGKVLRSDSAGVAVSFDENYKIINTRQERHAKVILH